MRQCGFFEIEDCYSRLDAAGDPLAKLDSVVDWIGFEALMLGILFDRDRDGGKGVRPLLCGLMMAKLLILQACNNLSDERAEFLINDRLSFKRFLGLGVNDKSPDAKSIWLWRERVVHSCLHEKFLRGLMANWCALVTQPRVDRLLMRHLCRRISRQANTRNSCVTQFRSQQRKRGRLMAMPLLPKKGMSAITAIKITRILTAHTS